MDPALLLAGALRKDTVESVGFLNDLVASMWPYINPAVARMTKEVVEPMFEELLPQPFKATEFLKIQLGTVPMKFDNADVVQNDKNGVRLFLDVHWDGKCDIELKSPIIGKYGVEEIKVKGRVELAFRPLLPVLPVVGAIQASFVNPPFVDLDFTGIADVADVSFLRKSIRKVIAQVVNQILTLPNRILVPLGTGPNLFEQSYIAPLGYLRITVERGFGFKSTGRLVKDVPDVYVQVGVGSSELRRSKTMNNSEEPEWEGQSFDFLFNDPQQMVRMDAWDDDLTGDDALGGAIFPAYHLLDAPNKCQEIPLQTSEGSTGAKIVLSAELRPFTDEKSAFDVVSNSATAAVAKKIVKSGFINVGLMVVGVTGATGIPRQDGLAPFCKVTVGEDFSFQTPVVCDPSGSNPMIDPTAPVFNSLFRVSLTPELLEEKPSVKFELCSECNELGTFTASFDEVLAAPHMTLRESAKMECGASLKISVMLHACT